MTVEQQLQKIEAMYTDNLSKQGVSSTAVGWNTPDCQRLRFDKLSQFALADSEPFSVNDYGCGFGAHLQYLTDKKKSVGHYYGYDISKDMLTEAEKQLKGLDTEVHLLHDKNISTKADYSFVSGTFNVRFDSTEEAWKTFIEEKLIEMDQYTNKAFSFNLLTSYVDWREPHLFYGDPLYWFDFCKTKFSKKIALLHDYELWEWTILVDKR